MLLLFQFLWLLFQVPALWKCSFPVYISHSQHSHLRIWRWGRECFDGYRAKLVWCLDFKDFFVLFVHTRGSCLYWIIHRLSHCRTQMISDMIPVEIHHNLPTVCAEMDAQSFLPLHATNPSPSIYLFISLCAGWNPTFPTEVTRVAPEPVCHYRWPVVHFYLPLISRPPWEAANSMLHREGGGSKGWGVRGVRR